jgi:alkaline phosphatase D
MTKPVGPAGVSGAVAAHGTGAGTDRTRRTVVRGLGTALAGAVVLPSLPGSGWSAQAMRRSGLFTLGVCSGDPGDDGFVLWTRLAPDPLEGGGMGPEPVDVLWEVATDPDLDNVVQAGLVTAFAEHGHAVRVNVRGLASDAWFYYRFSALGEQSRIGRSRTFPSPLDGGVGRMRFALASCQNYEDGFYAAHRDMVAQDLDFVLHVGDYIYEYAASPNVPQARRHIGAECETVADYRNRYALYRLDPNLQDAHAAYPFIVTWDDHEVDNNYAGPNAEDDQAATRFRQRRANAYQVYRETMPLSPSVRLRGDHLHIFRRLQFGDLATLHVLDTRQYRTDQPCGDALPAFESRCLREINSPAATMTGAAQEAWLYDGLRRSTSTWNVLAQQVMMMEWDIALIDRSRGTYNPDAWDGYRVMRRRLLDFLATERPNNPVVLSGDIHSAWAADLKPDFGDDNSPVVASEFVCTGVTSGFIELLAPLVDLTLANNNEHIRYFEGRRRGYCLCEVTAERWTTHFRAVESTSDPHFTVPHPDLDLETIASFSIEAGTPGLVAAETPSGAG